jgi:transposase
MPAPYSVDLRWGIVRACERGGTSQREVADLFQVSLATVENVLRRYRRTGDVTPKVPEWKSRGLLDPAARQQLARWVHEQRDVMLAELQARFA